MQLWNTVYCETACKTHIRHKYLIIRNNCHILMLSRIVRINFVKSDHKTSVHFFNDHIYTRKNLSEHIKRPFFKSLAHYCMVCVCEYMSYDVPCLIPTKTFFVHQQTHHFRNSHCRVCIIDMNNDLIRQFWPILTVSVFKFFQNPLQCCRNKEILLL